MNVIAMFVLGLLLGWLAEWAIDWAYWRGRIGRISDENTGLREQLESLKRKKNPVRLSAKNIPIVDADGNDNLQAIKGVGPVFAKRLKDAGVLTFEKLYRMKSAELVADQTAKWGCWLVRGGIHPRDVLFYGTRVGHVFNVTNNFVTLQA